ncbi:hypothetical protein Ahy_B02g057317 [Arachis hypogaea]|uniref:Uncharacterized protein n=1 Tax=Arachis hypogaea TaxID=3818 RepID=A0A445ABK9_ARAHY|nr:hypothetical protein Ahy_B02g057317 [Arachis hypogaea]
MDNITECNWDSHVLNFIIKGITNYCLKKRKSIDGCLYALIIVYFHLTIHTYKKEKVITGLPWVSHWNRELLVARIRAEIDGHIVTEQNTFSNLGNNVSIVSGHCQETGSKKEIEENERERKERKKKKTKKKKISSSESDFAFFFESESEQDSEEPTKTRKQPTRTAKKGEHGPVRPKTRPETQ